LSRAYPFTDARAATVATSRGMIRSRALSSSSNGVPVRTPWVPGARLIPPLPFHNDAQLTSTMSSVAAPRGMSSDGTPGKSPTLPSFFLSFLRLPFNWRHVICSLIDFYSPLHLAKTANAQGFTVPPLAMTSRYFCFLMLS
jgi:hypothetical protein